MLRLQALLRVRLLLARSAPGRLQGLQGLPVRRKLRALLLRVPALRRSVRGRLRSSC